MRLSRIVLAVAAAMAFSPAIFWIAKPSPVVAAQTAAAAAPQDYPAPTNLKVLPRNLTGAQVHEIMQTWAGELGARCTTCHVIDKTKTSPDGKPVLDFANDKKEEKQTARLMFKMVDQINVDYVAKIDSSGDPVTCGTCHRGHLGPEPFQPPPPPAR